MFRYTKSELATKANEMNFVRDTLEKVMRLADILGYLNSNPLTKEYLVLKGGTAINLTVFQLPRLSVDIDLDFSKNVSREDELLARHIRTNTEQYGQLYTRLDEIKHPENVPMLIDRYNSKVYSKHKEQSSLVLENNHFL